MLIIQLTGLSGAGKTTLANGAREALLAKGIDAEVLDGDTYRQHLCKGLGFSQADQEENIRRLGVVASVLARHGIVAIIAAINPYESARQELRQMGTHVKLVWVDCDLPSLLHRDTKSLYKKAMLPEGHPERVAHFTGISDPFEIPASPDLVIQTHTENESASILRLVDFITAHLPDR